MNLKTTITAEKTRKYTSPSIRLISIESEGEILTVSGDDNNRPIENVSNGVGINPWSSEGNDDWFTNKQETSDIWK